MEYGNNGYSSGFEHLSLIVAATVSVYTILFIYLYRCARQALSRRSLATHDLHSLSLKLSTFSLSLVNAVIASTLGMYVTWATADDFLHSESRLVRFYVFIGSPYLLLDTIAMYLIGAAKGVTLMQYLSYKRAIVIHHLLFGLLPIPIQYYYACSETHCRGDFLAGIFMLFEVPVVCLNAYRILEILDTRRRYRRSAAVLGVLVVVFYLVFRVVAVPFSYYRFLRQCGADASQPLRGIERIPKFCHVATGALFLLFCYWFAIIVGRAVKQIRASKTSSSKSD